MINTLSWRHVGTTFEDGSNLTDWRRVYESVQWHWQYDTHELSFDIYQHDGQFWKLYRIRSVPQLGDRYDYSYGGLACRMALVGYNKKCRSPHSSRLMEKGDEEWVRIYEVDHAIHTVIKTGNDDPKYSGT